MEKNEASQLTQIIPDVAVPGRYRVLLHNDDITPMDFVVEILMTVFNKKYEEAKRIMLEVHHHDIACCGVYIYEVAETKSKHVREKARSAQYPLYSSIEKDQ